ncbi:MAG: hypothetical protein AAF636_23300 [Pseudomonadota bacterium]
MQRALAVGRLQEGKMTEHRRAATVFEATSIGGASAFGPEKEIGSTEVG